MTSTFLGIVKEKVWFGFSIKTTRKNMIFALIAAEIFVSLLLCQNSWHTKSANAMHFSDPY